MRKNLLIVQNRLAKIANVLDEEGLYYTANRLDEINDDLFKQSSILKESQASEGLQAAVSSFLSGFVERIGAGRAELRKIISDLVFRAKQGEENALTTFLKNNGFQMGSFTDACKTLGIPIIEDPLLYRELGEKAEARDNPHYMNRGGNEGVGYGEDFRREFVDNVRREDRQ